MAKYDGPSIFKKNHPKITSLTDLNNEKESDENKKTSWVDKDNYFQTDYAENIPASVQTRTDLQQKARAYMDDPLTQSKENPPREMKEKEIDRPVKNNRANRQGPAIDPKPALRFRGTYVPKSLQHLNGWKNNQWDENLYHELTKRLAQEPNAYLLFEEFLAPEIAEVLEDYLVEEKNEAQILPQRTTWKKMIRKSGTRKMQLEKNRQVEEKAEIVQEKLNESVHKPTTGLHRSLSKIIAEDQEAINKGKTNLGSLFSEED